jgi:hypothetical protein
MWRPQRFYRQVVLSTSVVLVLAAGAAAQEDKKTDDDKPADPDTGESTVEEKTLGLLPNPLQKYGVKFAATYIGEAFGNASGGLKQGAIYEGRLNLAVDVDLQKLVGIDKLLFTPTCSRSMAMACPGAIFRTSLSSAESRLYPQRVFTKRISRSGGARRGSR